MSRLQSDLEAIGGLSNPSKMPGYSYSIPARYCITGAKLARIPGTVCFDCYALGGCYLFASTVSAMERRWQIIMGAMHNPGKRIDFINAFVRVLRARFERDRRARERGKTPVQDCRYFRWHDSGDLQGIAHLEIIAEIAAQLPQVSFWLPTREAATVRAYLKRHGTFPSNLVVRVSASKIDGKAPEGFPHVSGVHSVKGSPPAGMRECQAFRTTADGTDRPDLIGTPEVGYCGDCRACWDPEISGESYPLH